MNGVPGQGVLSVDSGSSAVDVQDIIPDTRISPHLHDNSLPGTDFHAPAASLAAGGIDRRPAAVQTYGPGHADLNTRPASVTVPGNPHRESGKAVNVPEKALGLSKANGIPHRAATVATEADIQHAVVVDAPQPGIEPVVHHHGIQAAPQRLPRVRNRLVRRNDPSETRVELPRRAAEYQAAQVGRMASATVSATAQALGHDADGAGRADERFDDGHRQDHAFTGAEHAADRDDVGGGVSLGIIFSERRDALPQAGGFEEAHHDIIEETGSSHMCTLVLKLDTMPEKIRHN